MFFLECEKTVRLVFEKAAPSVFKVRLEALFAYLQYLAVTKLIGDVLKLWTGLQVLAHVVAFHKPFLIKLLL